jgi:flagellar basal-body rod protein FlgB
MSGITLTDKSLQTLSTALDGLATRQRAIGNNMANVDTPGFKASQVSFEQALTNANQGSQTTLALVTSNPQHIPTGAGGQAISSTTSKDTSQRLDGNNVDLEKEMTSLAETSLNYQSTARVVSLKLSLLRSAITEGKK